MRALAEFVMKGRTEAVMVSALMTGMVLFAWVGAAVVALVTLRKGAEEGSKVLLWTMLPAIFWAAMGDTGPVTTLLATMVAAMALRSTASWPMALSVSAATGLVTTVVLITVGRGYIEQIAVLLNDGLQQIFSQLGQSQQPTAAEPQAQAPQPSVLQVASLFGLSNTMMVVVCLVLARWWQALLYNPGGFRQEFHSLRLPPVLASVLLILGVLLSTLGSDYRLLSVILGVPFVIAGVALVHGIVGRLQLSSGWLAFAYIGWLMLTPLKAIVFIAAVLDSWIDFRSRLPIKNGDQAGPGSNEP